MIQNGAATVKRFYKLVTTDKTAEGCTVLLDGRSLKTKAKKSILVPTEALAIAIAEEWQKQGEEIDPLSMPIMTLASTAIDLVEGNEATKIKEISRYAETDLICYYAEGPEDLVNRQRAAWEPLHSWSKDVLAAPLETTDSIIAVPQKKKTLERLSQEVQSMNHWQIAAMQELVSLSGSLVVALALNMGRLKADQAIEATQIEENFQAEKWGVDEEEAAAREQKSQDLRSAVNFLLLLGK